MKKAIIIGAGPAGLTAAYELLKKTDIIPVILEKSEYIGGISRTIDYKGNRMDMGPHRFFSKSDRVMEWWLNIMPLREGQDSDLTISYQNKSRTLPIKMTPPAESKGKNDRKRMLVIQRLTRIYFMRKFFAYPIQLSIETLKTLGFIRTISILLSFLRAKLFPRPAKSLEDFIINQFGQQLYQLFFKDYTEKVWGVPCREISAEWGAQRIKGVSLGKAIGQAVKSLRKGKTTDLSQKETETSLIEQFLYPRLGPGSLWEEVAKQVQEMGGEVHLNQEVRDIYTLKNEVCSVHALNSQTGELCLFQGDYFFSTMPVKELIANMGEHVPTTVREIAEGLEYRDFINVGILLRQLSAPGADGICTKLDLKDNWIYIQERDVKVGRLMIYNNWGDGMVSDPGTVWLGMEYFCNKTDDFWSLDDEMLKGQAIMELEKMGLGRSDDVLDATVRRMEKTYPAYFGTYGRFEEIRKFTDQFGNLFLIGRNGMHKYNNADHSMLTAMVAVDNICTGVLSKENIWAINTEQEYHEEKQSGQPANAPDRQRSRVPAFISFLWHNRWNRAYCICAVAIFILQFILFKFRYPYANYMPDSYYYLEAAYNNADVNIWPVAYSKFLRLVSVFTHSDKLVVGFQYLFMQLSTLVFVYTVLFFMRPARWVRNFLLGFLLFSPVPLYVANYISADALFIGFSMLWFSSLLATLYRPSPGLLILQAVLLFACFVLRYNAVYYPVIAVTAWLLSPKNWKFKAAGIGLSVLLILVSFLYTSGKMETETGHRQFSAFGGWQLANNALYMYQHISSKERGPVPVKFAGLETMVRQHMDTLNKVKFSHEDSANSYFYLWSGRGPLVQYLQRQWKKDSTTPYFKRWASEGPLYLDYALYLIGKYPFPFLESFVLPNSIKLAVPPTEFLGVYNMGEDSVGKLAKDWFNYKSQKVKEHNRKAGFILMTAWYPIFIMLVNVLLVIHLIGLLVFQGFSSRGGWRKLLFLGTFFWLLNSGFSVIASPIVLRYQLLPAWITLCLGLLAGDIIYTSVLKKENAEI